MGRLSNSCRYRAPIDTSGRVRQLCITVKTATVRDLRNHFARLAKWIEHGEQITITRDGEVFAKLLPATPDKPRKVDWAAHLKKHKPVGKGMSKEATEKLWSDLRD
jgi:antitoxin (DNA-binding transcriptional repressor) of toxin-antitoxin stability system